MDAAQLTTLFELAKTSRDAAGIRLARLEQQARQAREHLQTLEAYSSDYAAKLQAQAGDELDPAAQANKREFLARLRLATETQKSEVGGREQACAAARGELAQCQRKIKSLETLMRRRHEEINRIESRREQGRTDEAAQRLGSSDGGPSGSASTQDLFRL
jgi:flagellar FliJ protein